ncbi:hypothetical protein ACCO45_010044 [Purpureocillium lilacinum]|uniref:Uncharacterized protein n=1 Tax=Purpureocillium lilacinum TaxID=33203 RepID=A0ACC4DDR8_PURLI
MALAEDPKSQEMPQSRICEQQKSLVTERQELGGQAIAELYGEISATPTNYDQAGGVQQSGLCSFPTQISPQSQETPGALYELSTPPACATSPIGETSNNSNKSEHMVVMAPGVSGENFGQQEYHSATSLPLPARPSLGLRHSKDFTARELQSLELEYAQLESRRQRILEIETIERRQADLRARLGLA